MTKLSLIDKKISYCAKGTVSLFLQGNNNLSTMNVLVVLAHPELKSFNGAMYKSTIEALTNEGHQVKVSDLYRMNFDPVSGRDNFTTVKDASFLKVQLEEVFALEHNGFVEELSIEQEKVEWCDLMIWHFPLWWFSIPAILKGWQDRVFAMGRFYKGGHLYEDGMMKGKKVLLAITTGTEYEAYQYGGFYNGDMESILRPIHRGMFEFLGFSVLKPQICYAVAHITNDERKKELEKWESRLMQIEEEEAIIVGKY